MFNINGIVMLININVFGLMNVNGIVIFGCLVIVNGEFISKFVNVFRVINGDYGFFICNDAFNTYFLFIVVGD